MLHKTVSFENPKINLQMNVGPKGTHVSGGQKQRIAIARAFLRKPTVLLLDEATSALDSRNESIVQKTIEKMMRGKTMINISHKLENVSNCDKIIVVMKGRVE